MSAFPHIFTLKRSKKRAWLGAESNRRHVDFQSTALPTELPSRLPVKNEVYGPGKIQALTLY